MQLHKDLTSYVYRHGRLALMIAALAALSVIGLLTSLMVGSQNMGFTALHQAAQAHFTAPGTGGINELIVFGIRLPRSLMAYTVGACLSVSGVCMQGIFKNPMAEPHILGVSGGAAFGAAISMIFGLGANLMGLGVAAVGALIGGLGAALSVMLLSGGGKSGTTNLLLSGVAVGTFLTAMLSGLLMIFHDKMEAVYTWTMGSFQAATMTKLSVLVPVTIICTFIIRIYARELNAMLLGEADARALGVNVGRTRILLLVISTLMTSVAVSMSGVIGFVGLMVPHAIRQIGGADHRAVVPMSMLAGGLYLMGMDTLSRTLFLPIEMPVGVLTALFGGPFFLILLQKNRRKTEGAA